MKYELGPLRILLCPSVRPSVCHVRDSRSTAKIHRKIIYIYIRIVVLYTRYSSAILMSFYIMHGCCLSRLLKFYLI